MNCCQLAEAEIAELEPQIERLEAEIKSMLLPKDPRDRRNVIMEIRAGTGGDEAALFAADLFRMYSRYAEQQALEGGSALVATRSASADSKRSSLWSRARALTRA